MIRSILDKKGGWLLLSAAAIALFFIVNLAVGEVAGMRFDLSKDRLYTLSPGTRNILQKLKQPVNLTLYYSDTLGTAAPIYGNYAARVKDMLRVFENASNGNLTLTVENPKPFSETEDKAVELGMQGVPLDETGEKVYFGLTAASGDKNRSIAFFQIEREKFLEYDIASLIQGIETTAKPVLAVYSARPMFGNPQMQMRGLPSRPWAIVETLRRVFDVRHIFTIDEVWKEKPTVLMVVHPGDLDDQDYYNLDQFLLRGGKAMIFADPYNETASARQMGMMPERVSSDLSRLLDHWGVEIVKDRVAGDLQFARRVNAGDDQRIIPAPYLSWMTVRQKGISQDDAVTSNVTTLNLQSAGIIKVKPEAKLKFEPLVTTTQESQEIDVKLLDGRRPKILEIVDQFKPSGVPIVVAARLSGRTTTLFPDGPPKKEEPKEEEDKEKATGDEQKESKTDTETRTESASQPAKPAVDGAKDGTDAKAAPAAETPADKTDAVPATDSSEKPVVKSDTARRDSAPATVAQAATGDAAPAEKTLGAAQGEPKADAEKPAETPAVADEKPAEGAPKPADAPAAAEPKPAAGDAEKPAEKAEEEPKAPPFVAESTEPMNVILVADADMLEDRFWVRTQEFFGQRIQLPFANNADFVVNAVENLAGGNDLISLRGRGTAQRPFTTLDEIRLAANRKFRAEERELQKKLQDAEKKLAELQERKKEGGSKAAVDKAVEATATQFTQEILATRKALRQVQLKLREDIESLQERLRFVNIALIPILVGILAVILGVLRMRRRKHAVEPQTG